MPGLIGYVASLFGIRGGWDLGSHRRKEKIRVRGHAARRARAHAAKLARRRARG